jgi:hypothetical protein
MLALLRSLSAQEAEAWLWCGRRTVGGVPPPDAGAAMLRELGREAPADLG